ncbi:AAA family ATPase [Acidobacteriota bacterium]
MKITTLKELLSDKSVEEFTWVVEDIIPEGSLVMLSGAPGDYKTWLALALAKAVSTGREFLGRKVKQTLVFYIDKENSKQLLRARIKKLNILDQAKLNFWLRENDPPFLNSEQYLDISNQNPRSFLIFDSLRRFHLSDENDSREMARIMNQLSQLTKSRTTVLLIHHKGKSEFAHGYRGSSDILASVDIAFSLEKGKKENGSKSIKLNCIKHRFIEDFSLDIEISGSEGIVHFKDITEKKNEERNQEKKEKFKEERWSIQGSISAFFKENNRYPNQSEVVRMSTYGRDKMRNVLKNGNGIFWIEKQGKGAEKIYIPKG